MTWSVHNPTHRPKAVRFAGGLATVRPGQTVQLAADWSEAALAQYAAAGLQLSRSGAEPAPEPAPAEEPATSSSSSRADLLQQLASDFPEGDDAYWMRDGRPQVNMLNASLPEGEQHFSAAERDEIWRSLQQ